MNSDIKNSKQKDIVLKNDLTNNKKIKKNSSFVKRFFGLFLPSALQNLAVIIVFFINNIFLSQLSNDGTTVKTSAGLANPILNFVLLVIIAWSGGLSIMMGQYYGSKEHEKNQQLIPFGFMVSFILYLPFLIIILIIPKELMNLMSGADLSSTVSSNTIEYGATYLQIMSFSFIPFIFVEILSTGFQTTNKSIIPLYSVIFNIAINIVFVPIAIYLTSNNPMLSIILVAIIDIIAKICQALYLFLYIYIKKYQPIYFFKKLTLQKEVMKKTIKYGLFSFLNDVLFSLFLVMQSFSVLNYSNDVKENNWITNDNTQFGNIQNSTTNVNLLLEFSNVIWPGMAAATSVLVGNSLGQGDIKQAKQNAKQCLLWSFIISLSLIILLFSVSWFINDLLNPQAKKWENILAMFMEWALLPVILSQGIFSVVFFSIRTGGSKIIVVCDSMIMGLSTLITLLLTIFGVMDYVNPVVYVFILQADQIIRMIVSVIMFKYYHWAKNLTGDKPTTNITSQSIVNEVV